MSTITPSRLVYNLLFQAASATIQEVAADPKHLGAQVGLLLVLYTWGQNLHLHPHVHGLVTAGGLACVVDKYQTVQFDSKAGWS